MDFDKIRIWWSQRRDARRRRHIFLEERYGAHNLKCPCCGRRLHKVERKFLFSWLTVRRETSCIEMKYDPLYDPYVLMCKCLVCGATFGKPPLVPHQTWKVIAQVRMNAA